MEYRIIKGINPTDEINNLAKEGWIVDNVQVLDKELVYILKREVQKTRTKTKVKA